MIEDFPPPATEVPPPTAFPMERGEAVSGSVAYGERRQSRGLNGYIYITRDNLGTNGAGLFLRMVAGQLTETRDEYVDGSPPTEWGSEIFAIHYLETAGYSITEPWFPAT